MYRSAPEVLEARSGYSLMETHGDGIAAAVKFS